MSTNCIDVSAPVSVKAFRCLKEMSYSCVIVRMWRSIGKFDQNAVQTVKNARSAGIDNVDGYIFPRFKQLADSARHQVQKLLEELSENGVSYDRLWVDVEDADHWSTDPEKNVRFLEEMVNELRDKEQDIGFYASKSQWEPITGGSTQFSSYPLWYPRYKNPPNPNFSDFEAFGGWSSPVMKQYAQNVVECGVDVDKNWKP
ncbi:glycosyl hydrolases family 25 domain-containing protein [Ditylenchus destructor]|nr:glycosyl hydrolases family 25 domain-containing protein [Ditylenchus destructor]